MCRNKIDSFIHLKFWIVERMKARDYLNSHLGYFKGFNNRYILL